MVGNWEGVSGDGGKRRKESHKMGGWVTGWI